MAHLDAEWGMRNGAAMPNRPHVGEVTAPFAGGRVHFSGGIMNDKVSGTGPVPNACDWFQSVVFVEDNHSEFVGCGRYPDNEVAFPKAIAMTFDGIAVDAGTRLTIYEQKNFGGSILYEKVGPAVLVNGKEGADLGHSDALQAYIKGTWTEPLNSLFVPLSREITSLDMHSWRSGSCVISGGEIVSQALKKSLPEYAACTGEGDAVMCIACGKKPTWNGKPGEKCSKRCIGCTQGQGGPTMCITCGKKPTWNGKPGEKCSKRCTLSNQGQGEPAMCTACGRKPTWNGKPGEKCSRGCVPTSQGGPAMCTACGKKPTWNGKPGEKCSRGCIPVSQGGPAMCISCGKKPTWNGKPGEKCSKGCTPGSQSGLAMCATCGKKPSWNGKPGEKCSKVCRA